jgi:hypothetical protein
VEWGGTTDVKQQSVEFYRVVEIIVATRISFSEKDPKLVTMH